MIYDKNADIPDDPMADFGYAWVGREHGTEGVLGFMAYEHAAEVLAERCEDDPCDDGTED